MDTLIAGHSQLKGVRELLQNHPTVSVSCHPGRRTEELFALVEEVLPSCEVMYYDKTTPAMLWLCKHLRSPSAFCRYIIMHKYEPLFINRTVGADNAYCYTSLRIRFVVLCHQYSDYTCIISNAPAIFCRYIIVRKYEPLFINRTVGASCQNFRVLQSRVVSAS